MPGRPYTFSLRARLQFGNPELSHTISVCDRSGNIFKKQFAFQVQAINPSRSPGKEPQFSEFSAGVPACVPGGLPALSLNLMA